MRRLVASFVPFVLLASLASTAAGDESLSPKDVLPVMAHRRTAIRKLCYEDRADKADTSMKIDFMVASNGVVTDVSAKEVVGKQEIVDCVIAEVKKTVFPASEKGGRFRWPFVFKGP